MSHTISNYVLRLDEKIVTDPTKFDEHAAEVGKMVLETLYEKIMDPEEQRNKKQIVVGIKRGK